MSIDTSSGLAYYVDDGEGTVEANDEHVIAIATRDIEADETITISLTGSNDDADAVATDYGRAWLFDKMIAADDDEEEIDI